MSFVFADIIRTDSAQEVLSILSQTTPSTLVLFDIDDVLFQATSEYDLRPPLRRNLLRQFKNTVSKSDFEFSLSDFLQKRTITPVDPCLLDYIRLHTNGIPTAALTAYWTGPYGKITCMEDLRFQEFKQMNLSFSSLSPFTEDVVFENLKGKYGPPMVKHGVIFTSLVDKGVVLQAVLEHYNLVYDKIIFIDDQLSFLESVEKICQEKNISFTGIYYTKVENTPVPELNEDMERLRFDILAREGVWLTDAQLKDRKAL